MSLSFSKEQRADVISSIRRFCTENLDSDLSEMHAGFLLDYFSKEIAPFAYNRGVEDAQKYFIRATEDLPGACFEEALTFWKTRGSSRETRRKPGI